MAAALGTLVVMAVILGAALYFWVIWKGRHAGASPSARDSRRIAVIAITGFVVVGTGEGVGAATDLAGGFGRSLVAGAAIGLGVWLVAAVVFLRATAPSKR